MGKHYELQSVNGGYQVLIRYGHNWLRETKLTPWFATIEEMSAYMYQYLREMAYGVYYERAFGKEETERLRKQLFDEYYGKYLEENGLNDKIR